MSKQAKDRKRYDSSVDGSLGEYLGKNDSPLFRGSGIYEVLWNDGFVDRGVTVVRLIGAGGARIESYGVREDGKLYGLDVADNPGRSGTHSHIELIGHDEDFELIGANVFDPEERLEGRLGE
jgi:hypothetical protein